MIKSWNFFNNKFSDLLIAGRPLHEYSRDSINYFADSNILELAHTYSSSFDNLDIFIKSNFIGFTPNILRQILDVSSELPICCEIQREAVLYITNSKTAGTVNPEQVFINANKNFQVINLDDILNQRLQDIWLINSAEILSEYNAYIQEKLYRKAIENEVYILDKQSVYLAHDTIFGQNITIEPNVYFGSGVTIEDNVIIKSFSYLEGVTIRDNATIGPFARIRPKSEIKQNAKVGNFVEIKNSVLGSKTKVGHLSYVGDSALGNNVNVGAGVVTCNYDGLKKHKTIVGDNVFLGTNSSIVAPITIGHNSFVGAGSFINKNVPDGNFAIGRAKQQNRINTKNKQGEK